MEPLLEQNKCPLFMLAALILLLQLAACAPGGPHEGGKFELLVTRDYGREEIFSGWVTADPGQPVLDVMQELLEMETGYGGRFISSIEGLESGGYKDWFFYCNGAAANVGGGDYYPREGDHIWWDYHSWSGSSLTPAVTGSFPRPFTKGYRGVNPGTTILAADSCLEWAEVLKSCLKDRGAEQVSLEPYHEEKVVNSGGATIVIALWPEIEDDAYWTGLQENNHRAGWFARLSTLSFIALDWQGEEIEHYRENTGAVLASGSGLGDTRPVWLITAQDSKALENTLNIIVGRSDLVTGTFGFLVNREEVIPLPR